MQLGDSIGPQNVAHHHLAFCLRLSLRFRDGVYFSRVVIMRNEIRACDLPSNRIYTGIRVAHNDESRALAQISYLLAESWVRAVILTMYRGCVAIFDIALNLWLCASPYFLSLTLHLPVDVSRSSKTWHISPSCLYLLANRHHQGQYCGIDHDRFVASLMGFRCVLV